VVLGVKVNFKIKIDNQGNTGNQGGQGQGNLGNLGNMGGFDFFGGNIGSNNNTNNTNNNSNTNTNIDYKEQYKSQLQQLKDMGFTNDDLNLEMLKKTYGNVDAAVERLLNMMG
jgi:ubiquilin